MRTLSVNLGHSAPQIHTSSAPFGFLRPPAHRFHIPGALKSHTFINRLNCRVYMIRQVTTLRWRSHPELVYRIVGWEESLPRRCGVCSSAAGCCTAALLVQVELQNLSLSPGAGRAGNCPFWGLIAHPTAKPTGKGGGLCPTPFGRVDPRHHRFQARPAAGDKDKFWRSHKTSK